MPRNFNNVSGCPGSDVILELLRAEHAQVKQRTDIIKQLIMFNCSTNSEVRNGSLKSSHPQKNPISKNDLDSLLKTNLSSNIADISRQFDLMKKMTLNAKEQSSFNNRESRHAKCFLPYYDTVNDPKPNKCLINSSYTRIFKESSEMTHQQKGKPTLPNYSQIQFENKNEDSIMPTYSQFQNEAKNQSTPKKIRAPNEASNGKKTPTLLNSKSLVNGKTLKNTKVSSTETEKYLDQSTIANQTEGNIKNEYQRPLSMEYDYKLETHRLMQEVTELKIASKRYEEEKSDWINEKRRQIRILQQLRDASCDETKAAMKLTSWKPSDIECNPTQYEESKRIWLLCKKNQIELLERLRGVSLCEIRKGIERLSNIDQKCFDYELEDDRCRSMIDFSSLPQSGGQELYNNDKISVRICGPEMKDECFDKDKININILMKSNNNISDFDLSNDLTNPHKGVSFKMIKSSTNNSSKGTRFEYKERNQKIKNDSIFHNDILVSQNEEIPSTSVNIKDYSHSNDDKESIEEMKRNLENEIGKKLFQNTYNILSKLNCPQIIIDSAKSDDLESKNVLNYILEERRLRNLSEPNKLT